MTFVNTQPSIMYRHFKSNNTTVQITQKEAILLMETAAEEWNKQSTAQGNLYFLDKSEGNSLQNKEASDFFGFPIYGDCFLEEHQKAADQSTA